MVMEYLEHDLKALMKTMSAPFRHSQVKCLLQQLLMATDAMHSHWILHRDLKTSNLLLNNKGVLKVCDFGLARRYEDPIGNYTEHVVTLWYRCPGTSPVLCVCSENVQPKRQTLTGLALRVSCVRVPVCRAAAGHEDVRP
jgi:hypothetical protein